MKGIKEAEMQGNRDKQAELSESTGTDPVHERRKANPNGADMTDPKQVWSDAETVALEPQE